MSISLYPLASLSQIERTPSHEDGIPDDLEQDLRVYGCKLIHEAGVLLKQKQVAVATAQILFQRFWFVTSMKQFGIGDVGMGALYLASKLEECPIRMRDLINVYDLLLQRAAHTLKAASAPSSSSIPRPDFRYIPMSYFGSTFYDLKDALVVAEMQILKRLGFNVNVVLPYGTLINYLRVLDLTSRDDVCSGRGIPQRRVADTSVRPVCHPHDSERGYPALHAAFRSCTPVLAGELLVGAF
ncbi:Cyclin-L2 [Grifola frondosa]|uniref:Cyclin-L2 n=1 Tax=Grifola frondosa TaxID=5627 RepID=A0A1C7ML09_GRIFR|nr:Cyclin-L2 [Grifola frondosa]